MWEIRSQLLAGSHYLTDEVCGGINTTPDLAQWLLFVVDSLS